jgi:hypothetical protein
VSSLKAIEKRVFEDLFGMASGYVLDFSNNTFAEFFRETANIDIYAPKYDFNGESKAKRLRAFWETEPDGLVSNILSGLLEVWQFNASRNGQTNDTPQFKQAAGIVARLTGNQPDPVATEQEFLHRQYQNISIKDLFIDPNLIPVLESRLAEAQNCLMSARWRPSFCAEASWKAFCWVSPCKSLKSSIRPPTRRRIRITRSSRSTSGRWRSLSMSPTDWER